MHVDFTPSPGPSLGVEVEYGWSTKRPANTSRSPTRSWHRGAGHPEAEHPKAKHELFNHSIEVITGVCQTLMRRWRT